MSDPRTLDVQSVLYGTPGEDIALAAEAPDDCHLTGLHFHVLLSPRLAGVPARTVRLY